MPRVDEPSGDDETFVGRAGTFTGKLSSVPCIAHLDRQAIRRSPSSTLASGPATRAAPGPTRSRSSGDRISAVGSSAEIKKQVTRRDARDRRAGPHGRSRASSTRTFTFSRAASGSRRFSCATPRRATSSCAASPSSRGPRNRARGSRTAIGTTSGGAVSCRRASGSTPSRRTIPVWLSRLDHHMSLANTAGAAHRRRHARHAGRRRRHDRARRNAVNRPASSKTTPSSSSIAFCRR